MHQPRCYPIRSRLDHPVVCHQREYTHGLLSDPRTSRRASAARQATTCPRQALAARRPGLRSRPVQSLVRASRQHTVSSPGHGLAASGPGRLKQYTGRQCRQQRIDWGVVLAETHDFSLLYRHLGLEPGCSLHDLRMAYRRRVARLHPDREQGDGQALKQLNILYGAALDFQRRMGRLPGTPTHSPATDTSHVVVRSRAHPAKPHTSTEPEKEVPTRLRTLALLMFILLLAALLWAAANQSLPWLS